LSHPAWVVLYKSFRERVLVAGEDKTAAIASRPRTGSKGVFRLDPLEIDRFSSFSGVAVAFVPVSYGLRLSPHFITIYNSKSYAEYTVKTTREKKNTETTKTTKTTRGRILQ